MRSEEELNRIAYEIRGAGLAVHRAIGPGCFESAYVPCLAHELRKRGLECELEVPLTLRYESLMIPYAYKADCIVCGCVLLECKAIEALAAIHKRQMQTYLRLSGCPLGLILNFGALRFFEGVVRQVNNFPSGTAPYAKAEACR
jgi:GxxExxY protein